MAKIDNPSGASETPEEQNSRTILSVLRDCKVGRLANTIAAVKLFALSLIPGPTAGCDEGTREEYMHADSADMVDFADYADADSCDSLDISPDSCDSIDIGPDSCDGIDIGPDSCDGTDVGPDATMSCELSQFDGEYGCNDGCVAVSVHCGTENTPVDVCIDDVQALIDACPVDSTTPLHVHCASTTDPECDLSQFDGEYECNDGCVANGFHCGNEYTHVGLENLCSVNIGELMDTCADDSTMPLRPHCVDNPQCDPHDFDGAYDCNDGCHAVGMFCEDSDGQTELIDVNLCGGESPTVCPDGTEPLNVLCR
ncbi:hypothetical protein ACFL21_03715 [Patescibacteria group bacterium]